MRSDTKVNWICVAVILLAGMAAFFEGCGDDKAGTGPTPPAPVEPPAPQPPPVDPPPPPVDPQPDDPPPDTTIVAPPVDPPPVESLTIYSFKWELLPQTFDHNGNKIWPIKLHFKMYNDGDVDLNNLFYNLDVKGHQFTSDRSWIWAPVGKEIWLRPTTIWRKERHNGNELFSPLGEYVKAKDKSGYRIGYKFDIRGTDNDRLIPTTISTVLDDGSVVKVKGGRIPLPHEQGIDFVKGYDPLDGL